MIEALQVVISVHGGKGNPKRDLSHASATETKRNRKAVWSHFGRGKSARWLRNGRKTSKQRQKRETMSYQAKHTSARESRCSVRPTRSSQNFVKCLANPLSTSNDEFSRKQKEKRWTMITNTLFRLIVPFVTQRVKFTLIQMRVYLSETVIQTVRFLIEHEEEHERWKSFRRTLLNYAVEIVCWNIVFVCTCFI